jgi:AcrR family transcriptional regulator
MLSKGRGNAIFRIMSRHPAVPESAVGQRGPTDHTIRDQIVEAAGEHFKHYGYNKTTVSDLASAIGFSKAYIYKFFDSKQAIGQAICGDCVAKIAAAAADAITGKLSATEKMRRFFRAAVDASVALCFKDRKLFDIAASATEERWPTVVAHEQVMLDALRKIIIAGRESGEFERKTPLDETTRVIMQAMQPYLNPLMLVHNLDSLPDGQTEIVNLILRSLAP